MAKQEQAKVDVKEVKPVVPTHVRAYQVFRHLGSWAVAELTSTTAPKIILTDLLYDDALFESARRNVGFARFERDEYGGVNK